MDSGEAGCPGVAAPRPAEEELSPRPAGVTLLLRPMAVQSVWVVTVNIERVTLTSVLSQVKK